MSTYTSRTWRATRAAFLSSHPYCVDCRAPATIADHCPPRRILIAAHIHDPDHPRHLFPRCVSCHDRKTATTDRVLLLRLAQGEDAHDLAELALEIEAVR